MTSNPEGERYVLVVVLNQGVTMITEKLSSLHHGFSRLKELQTSDSGFEYYILDTQERKKIFGPEGTDRARPEQSNQTGTDSSHDQSSRVH